MLTTHDLDEAARLCDRLAILNEGRIVTEGTPAALIEQVAREHGQPPTLERVFMTYTGRSLDEDVEENASGEDDD